MGALSRVQRSDLVQQSSGSESRSGILRMPSDDAVVMELGRMMSQSLAMKPNQTLPPGTPDLYLQAWEELAAEFGMERLQAGLWRALRRSSFFPQPIEIETACRELAAEDRARRRIAREAEEAAQRDLDTAIARKQHREDYPEQYDAEGRRLPMDQWPRRVAAEAACSK